MKSTKYNVGWGFGLTSGVITTLGLMIGLYSSTFSKGIVLAGIFTVAIADAFSDALGMHVSQEAQNRHSVRSIWESTLATFISKFGFALTFVVPVFLLPLNTAINVSVLWGLLILGIFSYFLAKKQKAPSLPVVSEHLVIALVVITITHYLGDWIGKVFG